jgi:hypothetical protein
MEDKVKDGGAAFPSSFRYDLEDWADPGMSLRDWFAGKAMAAIIARYGVYELTDDTDIAYEYADKMLRARKTDEL